MSGNKREAIIELAETVKELVRIIKCFPNYKKLPAFFDKRLDDVYRKASRAKNRMTAEAKRG